MIWVGGKIITTLIFWLVIGIGVSEGAPDVNQEDYDSLHAEVIELRKIKEIHQQQRQKANSARHIHANHEENTHHGEC